MSILSDSFTAVELYKEPTEFSKSQLSVFWVPDEIKVEKDVQDILVNLTPAERHGVITTLKLFTLYELKAGSEYWGGRFKETFLRPEFQRMASVFSMVELAIHKPFYTKINELLYNHTDDFYNEYLDDETLSEKVHFIDEIIDDEDVLLSLAGFSLVEGMVLYSSFAFLKHFQSEGQNKLVNIVRGINFSVRDENIHHIAGAWVYKKLKEEERLTEEEEEKYKKSIQNLVEVMVSHEDYIVDKIFEEGTMPGITSGQMKNFIRSRANECLHQLGYNKMYEIDYNPISSWFYKNITGYSYNDFFSGQGSQYHRNWDESSFTWS